MTPHARRGGSGEWESLAPWDKAAEWHATAPHIADELMALAKQQAEHLRRLDREEQRHLHKMDVRLWITQLVGMVGGIICIAGLIIVAWHYADTGNVVPGLAIFGIGTGLTAGVYGVGRAIGRQAQRSTGNGYRSGRSARRM
jgi:uncharacterized membrane protein